MVNFHFSYKGIEHAPRTDFRHRFIDCVGYLLRSGQRQTLTTLSSFDGTNGAGPGSGLILSGSTIYGTAWSGGANNDGTVFSMPVGGGAPTTLFSFDGTHGDGPSGGLILSGSTLYGTTFDGGANNDGTVFSVPVAAALRRCSIRLAARTANCPTAA